LVLVALALALAVFAASCGEGEEAGESPASETSLEVTLWPNGRGAGGEQKVVLSCDPPDGDHPQPDEACAALEAGEGALEPVPGDAVCTQIFGGPQEAHVAGVVRGRAIDATFNRSNGCEIDRWDRLAPVLEISPTA
jgi:Subtilisin inhibitor-like